MNQVFLSYSSKDAWSAAAIHEALHRSAFVSHWNLGTRTAVLVLIVALVVRMKEAFEQLDKLKTQQVQREFEMAREVQLRLLPSNAPSFSGLDVSYLYKPALMVGGDYYDFVRISPERLCIVVADIAGKGLPSALLMASLQGLIHNAPALGEGSLPRFASGLNASLYELTASNRYATLFIGILDTSDKTFEYVNAGHNPPLLFRSDLTTHTTTSESLDHAGVPVGLFPKTEYDRQQLVLREGDVLVLYTDGVTEALNLSGEEFGVPRLREAVTSALHLPATAISGRVKERLGEFLGESPPFDDTTLVVVKIAY